MKTLEALYGVPGEEPVVQLFVPDGGQFGEVRRRNERLEVELWTPDGLASYVVDAEELVHVITRATAELSGE
jgi:hypothetical protein